MLGNTNVHAVIAVKDLGAAKSFYVDTLGLALLREDTNSVMLTSGSSKLLLYISDYAGSNKATAASWEVETLQDAVEELRSVGITFERYDNIPGVTREGDIHSMGAVQAAWFKDPDGNILCIGNAL